MEETVLVASMIRTEQSEEMPTCYNEGGAKPKGAADSRTQAHKHVL